MELVERDEFLDLLQSQFEKVSGGEGHCIFISGEAGIGKTSLVKVFCKSLKGSDSIYQGTCDALFTPRPLAPLYDILLQLGNRLPENSSDIDDRTAFFTRIFHTLRNQQAASLVIFEDVHWADDATLDFIKFLSRRITQLHCLFILTYRDNEEHSHQALRNILGQLHTDSFTRLELPPLSKQVVEKMAIEKGYSGEDVYSISGGNPFYVNEILASYSLGIPDNIRDSILSIYHRLDEKTKHIWEIVSVLPTAFGTNYLERMEPCYAAAIENCIAKKILILDKGLIFFKHELYRRTIESSLSPLLRVALNKKILELFQESFEQDHKIERIIHHAKNANDYDLVVKYAPIAARQAAFVGAHTEAAKLYLSAIEYYQGSDGDTLIHFYESYAYECYLTNQVKEAIIYTGKSLKLLKEKNDTEKIGNCMRFLSRLWWLANNRGNAEYYGLQAVEVLSSKPSSAVKAMAFSNISQLKMLFDEYSESITWGEKAIKLAREVRDQGTLSHALNNVGSIKMNIESSEQEGIELLQQSLAIALENGLHEHAARAYSNLASNAIRLKKYEFAKEKLQEGILYCQERDLDPWLSNMLSFKASLHLETGDWKQACSIAGNLLNNESQLPTVTIGARLVMAIVKMRMGDKDSLALLLEAVEKSFETMESQYVIPALTALLQHEWLEGKTVIRQEDLDRSIEMVAHSIHKINNNEFAFWLQKVRKQHLPLQGVYEGYDVSCTLSAQNAAVIWEQLGNPFAQAITLFEGNAEDKRKAITIVQRLGADAVCEKMKFEMRSVGIKSIPRGIRKTTQSNPALLTGRELDILQLLPEGLQNKEIAARLFISAKTVDHHISSILYKLEVNSRTKAVQEATRIGIIK